MSSCNEQQQQRVYAELGALLTNVQPCLLPSFEVRPLPGLLAKCATRELAAACVEADEHLSDLVAALDREQRDGANVNLRVESAIGVASAAWSVAQSFSAIGQSVDRAPSERSAPIGDYEVTWRSALEGSFKPRDWTVKKSGAKTADLMEFTACMALATSALAEQLVAARLVRAADGGTAALVNASKHLREAAGLWTRVEERQFVDRHCFGDLQGPAELRPSIARAMRDSCLGAAGRLAIAKALVTGSNPPSLLARLADGAAKREAAAHSALDGDRLFDPVTVGSLGLIALGGSICADLFRALDSRTRDDLGVAIAWARRASVRSNTEVTSKTLMNDDLKLRLRAKNAAGSTRAALKAATAAAAPLLAELEKDNNAVYFEREVEPSELRPGAPLEIAKPTPIELPIQTYELREKAKVNVPDLEEEAMISALASFEEEDKEDEAVAGESLARRLASDMRIASSRSIDEGSSSNDGEMKTAEAAPFWSCQQCTFNNPPAAGQCEMCSAARIVTGVVHATRIVHIPADGDATYAAHLLARDASDVATRMRQLREDEAAAKQLQTEDAARSSDVASRMRQLREDEEAAKQLQHEDAARMRAEADSDAESLQLARQLDSQNKQKSQASAPNFDNPHK